MSPPIRTLLVADSGQTSLTDRLDAIDDIDVATATPASVLEGFDGRSPDCLVVAHDAGGLDTLARLDEAGVDAPLVLFAPAGDDDLFRRAITAGATEYVRTDDPDLLARRIRSAVECVRAGDADTNETRYERLVENLPVGVFRTTPGPDGTVVKANQTLAEIRGFSSADELVNSAAAEAYVDPDEREAFSRKLVEEGAVSAEELALSTRDGETVWVSETAIRTEAGGDVYFDGIVQDITERKEYEQELAATKTRFETLFEESPDMVFVHDDDGIITAVNRRACEKLGYDRDQLEGMAVWDVDVSVDEAELRRTCEQLPDDETPMFDGVYERADGSQFPVEIHLTCLDDGEFLAIARDVTTRRERERKLTRHNERLEAFVDVLSHDIPNHLEVAQTRLDIARTREEFDHLDYVETAHRRIESVVDDMKQLVEHGRDVEETQWILVSDVATACWENSQCSEGVDLDIGTDGYLRANESRLKQLLENLFWNACDHAGPDVTVTVGLLEDGFFVADDGPGIPPADREDVLSVGFTTDDDHSGFGLAIVREIARAHDWDIEVTDSEDDGARFEFHGVDVDPA